MSSFSIPKTQVRKSDGVIAKGKVVKAGSDANHCAQCTGSTDKVIGIAQTSATAAEQDVEIALPGGGGLALAQTTITDGALLVPHTDGGLKPIAASGNRLAAKAMSAAVSGDLFPVEVIDGQAVATE